jgi:NAD(P)-dependent dehydrogenase (short-subunit alcohol dehydrogenase family)
MNVVVLGADGHIGSSAVEALKKIGHDVTSLGKRDYNVAIGGYPLIDPKAVDAVLYAVGHCPADGFKEAVRYPLSEFPPSAFMRETDSHVRGPYNVYRQFLPVLRDGGKFIFMSSAATQLLLMPRDKRPLGLNIYAHLAVIAAEDVLIEGMRMDPETASRDIRIHRIAPPAIGDSPFHKGMPPSPRAVTTSQVVAAIIGALTAETHMDVVLAATPQAS